MKALATGFYLLVVLMTMNFNANSDTTHDAIDSALQATYIQSGTKEKIDDYGKCLEKRYIKKEQEKYWAAFVYIANSVLHSEIQVKWTF